MYKVCKVCIDCILESNTLETGNLKRNDFQWQPNKMEHLTGRVCYIYFDSHVCLDDYKAFKYNYRFVFLNILIYIKVCLCWMFAALFSKWFSWETYAWIWGDWRLVMIILKLIMFHSSLKVLLQFIQWFLGKLPFSTKSQLSVLRTANFLSKLNYLKHHWIYCNQTFTDD